MLIFVFPIADPCTVPTFAAPLMSTNCGSGTMVPDSTTCTFTCDSGYTLQTGVTVACSAGTIDQTLPTCNRKLPLISFRLNSLKCRCLMPGYKFDICTLNLKTIERKFMCTIPFDSESYGVLLGPVEFVANIAINLVNSKMA